jgi:hypothetical protein
MGALGNIRTLDEGPKDAINVVFKTLWDPYILRHVPILVLLLWVVHGF